MEPSTVEPSYESYGYIHHEHLEIEPQWAANTSQEGYSDGQFEDISYGSSPEEGQLYEMEEDLVLDLSANKRCHSDETFIDKRGKKKVKTIAQLLENFHYNDACYENFYSTTTQTGYCSPGDSSDNYLESILDYSIRKDDFVKETTLIERFKDAATNTDLIVQVEQDSQTEVTETSDASVQVKLTPQTVICETVEKPTSNNLRFSCSLCPKLYTTKSSYDRHVRAHVGEQQPGNRAIVNVQFLTQAKLQVYKRRIVNTKSKQEPDPMPIMVQVPKTSRQPVKCDWCQQLFSFTTQSQLNYHKSNECIYQPFPMTDCPDCPLKFYTKSCLDEHISLAHKKDSTANSHYCVFCNDKFDDTDSFHLHLDNHLHFSP